MELPALSVPPTVSSAPQPPSAPNAQPNSSTMPAPAPPARITAMFAPQLLSAPLATQASPLTATMPVRTVHRPLCPLPTSVVQPLSVPLAAPDVLLPLPVLDVSKASVSRVLLA